MSKLTADYPLKMLWIIYRIARKQSISWREVIRRALAIYYILNLCGVKIGSGMRLQIRDKKTGKVEKEIVF